MKLNRPLSLALVLWLASPLFGQENLALKNLYGLKRVIIAVHVNDEFKTKIDPETIYAVAEAKLKNAGLDVVKKPLGSARPSDPLFQIDIKGHFLLEHPEGPIYAGSVGIQLSEQAELMRVPNWTTQVSSWQEGDHPATSKSKDGLVSGLHATFNVVLNHFIDSYQASQRSVNNEGGTR